MAMTIDYSFDPGGMSPPDPFSLAPRTMVPDDMAIAAAEKTRARLFFISFGVRSVIAVRTAHPHTP